MLGKIRLDRKGTISHFDEVSTLNLESSNQFHNSPKPCLSHNYNIQTIRMLSDAFDFNDKGTLLDRIQLEESPLKLSFVSYDRNTLDTGVVVQVCIIKSIYVVYLPRTPKWEYENLITLNLFQLLGSTVPLTLWKIHVTVNIEGVQTKEVLEPEDELKYRVNWDKRDVYGQKVYGRYVPKIF